MATTNLQLKQRLLELHQNKLFEFFVIFIIVLSALLTGAKTYDVGSTANTIITWSDHFITLFFLFEIVIRVSSEQRFFNFFKKGWNVFDFVIVVASLLPLDGSDSVLLARLLRIFRVLRLVSLIPELRVLINALLKALPTMGYVVLLMFIIFYIYAAIGSFMFEHINNELWGNISISMLTLFRIATFEDWTDVMYETMIEFPLSWIFYLSFIFLTAFVFLNMMIGVILDVMQREQEQFQRDQGHGEAAEVHWLKQHAVEMEHRLERIEQLLIKNDSRVTQNQDS